MAFRPVQPGRWLRVLVLALPLLLANLIVPALPDERLRSGQDPQDTTAPYPRQGERLGKTVCKDCHEDEWNAISAGHHREVVHGDGMIGCELCHGPGKAHGEHSDNDPTLITLPAKLAPAQQTAVCLQCHDQQIEGHGGDLAGLIAAGKGCTACHQIHTAIKPKAHAATSFRLRVEAVAQAKAVGANQCVQCHPHRDDSLRQSHHRTLAAHADAKGCETCHGHGSLHVESKGRAPLITRPDRADDGVQTCVACHSHVDPREFHWKDKHKPLLSSDLRCTSCHTVHQAVTAPFPSAGVDPHTGEPAASTATNQLCATCHAPAMTVLDGTIHQALGRPEAPLTIGCGSCHAGAEAHARSGGKKHLVDSLHGTSAEHQAKTCTQCHGDEETLRHQHRGSHYRHDVTCLTCHSPAAPLGRVREDAEQKCLSCHQDVAAAFRQPNHHPVPEGAMGCSDCHNPHDARPKIRDRKLREDACVRCHSEYRGPFVYAHQAGRSDGCVACHEPHGASNRRLLTQHTSQQLCLQCHADFPAFHDQTSGAIFTNCLNCHTQVHGSNHSRFLFR